MFAEEGHVKSIWAVSTTPDARQDIGMAPAVFGSLAVKRAIEGEVIEGEETGAGKVMFMVCFSPTGAPF
ncbi:hypothetical protein A3F27_03110 [Candidatus Kaiserbacteria bacterium RIFCSPHIGHO2_12_FULL_53_13]|uniref:Uncharacterized protein n=1 Tax=Candidatus Kaiserbacteria bacterium RIFCSPHIGHO2_12_FULL_53_13 TaxID=1798502 RepID=A0A1F6E6S9_9BACT|nr:MAG: hypothetical protein A3F27_03110 [Candidatus Kaiserbacteria bacterium RIFCSPHIGHO2_12_FULL_53_13]